MRRQVAPRAARADNPEHRLDEAAVVAAAAPGSVGLPRRCGSIFAHWASVKTYRSIKA
jgi:hypothetical protein